MREPNDNNFGSNLRNINNTRKLMQTPSLDFYTTHTTEETTTAMTKERSLTVQKQNKNEQRLRLLEKNKQNKVSK